MVLEGSTALVFSLVVCLSLLMVVLKLWSLIFTFSSLVSFSEVFNLATTSLTLMLPRVRVLVSFSTRFLDSGV